MFGSLGRLRALRALFGEPERGFGQRELAAEAGLDPALARLVTLMQQDSALARTLPEALLVLPGVDMALIFGSVANGAARAANDVDLLVLGQSSELKLHATLKPAGRKLGRAVRVTASTIESFRSQLRRGESFALGVLPGPRVPLIGDLDPALRQATGQ